MAFPRFAEAPARRAGRGAPPENIVLAGMLSLFYNRSVVRNVLKFLIGGFAIVAIGASVLYFTQYLRELTDGSYSVEYEKAG